MEGGYHHGSLKAALLTEGRRILADDGIDALSLRELARRAGVSHAAPSRHFADRDALIDGLRDQGFAELTAVLEDAARQPGLRARLDAYARGLIAFVRANGPLAALMFSRKPSAGPDDGAASAFFAAGARILDEARVEDAATLPFLIAGTFEGLAALVVAGRLPEDRADAVIDAAVDMVMTRFPSPATAPDPRRATDARSTGGAGTR